MSAEDELREAIDGGQLELVYQPIVGLADSTLTGLEALARWRHPTRGPIMPGDFIPIAERGGLIVPLGRWMLAEVCREQEKDWPATYVNTSVHQLREPGFVASLRPIADERLVVEVTEDALLDDDVVRTLRSVRDLGAGVAIDDFGSGPASLRSLATAPIDVIKVHGSLTHHETHRQAAVARAVADLAGQMGIVAIAKAVESAAQAEWLHTLGYRQGMGFHYAVPQPATSIPLFLANEVLPTPG